MRNRRVNIITLLCCSLVFIKLQAQTFDKKYTESFDVNATVKIAIKSANTAIKIVTWQKNKVAVDGYISVSGVDVKRANSYLNHWKFNVSGNHHKIKIETKGDYGLGDGDEVVIFNKQSDFNTLVTEDNSVQQWKDSLKNVRKRGLEMFRRFKESKYYGKRVKKLQRQQRKINKRHLKKGGHLDKRAIDSVLLENIISNRKKFYQKKLARALTKGVAKKHTKFYKKNIAVAVLGNQHKKVHLKKTIVIYVPQKAAVNFNTRYCKITADSLKGASGELFYGMLQLFSLDKTVLKIQHATIDIKKVTNSKLTLNNVKKANITVLQNTTIKSSSTDLVLDNASGKVSVHHFFGKIWILKMDSDLEKFTLKLNNSEAILNVGTLRESLIYGVKKRTSNPIDSLENETIVLKGKIKVTAKKLSIDGKYSTLILH